MRISDWSSDVGSSDLLRQFALAEQAQQHKQHHEHHGCADDDIHQGSTVSSMGVCATGVSPSSSDTRPLLPPIRAGLICPSIFISSRSPAFSASYLNWNASPETDSSEIGHSSRRERVCQSV